MSSGVRLNSMCGIVGILGALPDLRENIIAASKALHHRGPDDSDVWLDDNEQIALGHTRLSILDLTPAGHQPMTSQDGRYVIAFNGEIYNHKDLRQELEAVRPHPWRGHSD